MDQIFSKKSNSKTAICQVDNFEEKWTIKHTFHGAFSPPEPRMSSLFFSQGERRSVGGVCSPFRCFLPPSTFVVGVNPPPPPGPVGWFYVLCWRFMMPFLLQFGAPRNRRTADGLFSLAMLLFFFFRGVVSRGRRGQ